MREASLEFIVKNLEDATKDCDVVVVENPLVGIYPNSTMAFKRYSEKVDKPVVYRHHDFVDDRPNLQEDFLKVFSDFDEAYARTPNVWHLTLTNYDKRRLIGKGIDAEVLPNSVILDDFNYDSIKAESLREFFQYKGIISSGEKAVVAPGRILGRKNIEEALLLTKILNLEGNRHRLIVTIDDKEDYKRELIALAEKHKIHYSLGQAGKYISMNGDGFNVSNLFSMANLVLTTSVMEGFGYSFIEPWLSQAPVIGRNLPKVTEDLVNSGMDLSHLYGEEDLPTEGDISTRIERIDSILGDRPRLKRLASKLNLSSRIEKAEDNIPHNDRVIRENYGHVSIARKLHEILEGVLVWLILNTPFTYISKHGQNPNPETSKRNSR